MQSLKLQISRVLRATIEFAFTLKQVRDMTGTYSQTPKLKPNQTMFDRTYSNLTSLFLSKILKVFR